MAVNYGSRYEKKKTPYGVFFALLILLLFVFYCVSGLYKIPGADLSNLQENLKYVFTHPFLNWNENSPAVMCIGLIIWAMVCSYLMYYYRDFHSEMEHGSEDWLDPVKACRELKDDDIKYNRILSQNLWVSLQNSLSNNNMLVIGSSGCFKTTSLMHQNLLQFLCSYVVLDVKGDTQRKLALRMKKEKYTIRSLNFKQPEKSDHYNPFAYVEREDDLLRVIKALHDACRPNKGASMADPFWDDAVDLFLKSLFYLAWLSERETGRKGSMNDVVRYCSMETKMTTDPITGDEVSELQLLINEKERKYGADYPPVRDYRELKNGAPDTVRSVILMINAMLSICKTAEVERIFEGDDDMYIRELGTGVGGNPDKKVALFLVIPDQDPVYNWIVSMFYTQMFDILIRLSDDELKRPLPVPVEVWMDEFYAGARPTDADILLGVVRSRNIIMIPVLQSVSQMKTLYKDNKWETIMDNTATVVFLGSGPFADPTHEYISKVLGNATMDSRDDNIHLGAHGNSGLNFKRTKRELMTPAEVKRMPRTECIIFLEGHPPIYDNKAIPFDIEKLEFKADSFLKKRYKETLDLGDYDHPVYTVYDPIHFHYITVKRETPLQVLTDPKEIETLTEAAKKDPNIYVYNIDEKDLLYLSWGKPSRSKEEIEQLYKDALEAGKWNPEQLRGLTVLQDVEMDTAELKDKFLQQPKLPDKSSWDHQATLQQLLAAHWDDLTAPEQEEICFALDDGLTEDQLRDILLLPLAEMAVRHRAYMMQNQAVQ